jgi:hypothetical protein
MKPFLKIAAYILLTGIVFYISCKKEYSCEGCATNQEGNTNKPPIAIAGPDQVITLPADSVSLDGGNSSDPDGTISGWLWTKISGPASFNILRPSDSITKVKALVVGSYLFELKVTDNGGLTAKDTMQVIVDDPAINQPPIARAGSDTSINYDLQSCSIPASFRLDGSRSTDPDGTIVSYRWSQWRPGTVVSPDSAITEVKNLLLGVNRFHLTVTDNLGATDQDEVVITVVNLMNRPTLQAQLVPIGTLSEARSGIAIAAAGNKILFAGGWPANPLAPASATVDIYDVMTSQWSTAQLSGGRINIGTAVMGNKIYLAGGGITQPNSLGGYEYGNTTTSTSSKVDIYDASANTWSTAQLSSPHVPTGASAGNKIVFAGGDGMNPSAVADIYDAATNSWSTYMLSASRHVSQAATENNKIFFGGGSRDFIAWGGPIYKSIDIYDASSNTWAVDTLSTNRGGEAAIGDNNKIYWGGGIINDGAFDETQTVEIKNLINNTTTFDCLCEEKAWVTAVRRGNSIIFFGGYSRNKFDIFDLSANTWSIGLLPSNTEIYSSNIISHNNSIYVFGLGINGVFSYQVFRLDF